jgi:hypothetical protein
MCGFVSDSEENTMQDPEDYEAISRKWGRCHVCSRSRDVKTQFVCRWCGHYICKDHVNMTVTCDTCKNKDETDENLISCLVFPTVLLLQTILSYLRSWIHEWILNITGIHTLYRANDNHDIVICHCYMRLSFQWCQTVVLLSVDMYFNLTTKELKTRISYNHFHGGVTFDSRWPSTS